MAKPIILASKSVQQVLVEPVKEKVLNRLFIGKAWHNTSSKNPGVTYSNIMFDKDIEVTIKDVKNNVAYVLSGKEGMFAYPNTKREGKRDADLRISIGIE